jgi:cell division protein FtsI (penicillin-binding protein 3)
VLGNNGLRMKPMLIREYRNEHGETLRRFEPEAEAQVISAETARATIDMMSTVVEEGGTGTRARIPGYAVAGKTGTAWKHIDGGGYSETERIGSFVGLVPADVPRVAIVVVVDGPTIGSKYGGVVAAPAFSSIGSAAMRILGVPPDPTLQGPPRLDDATTGVEGVPVEAAPPPAPVFVDIPTAAPELQWNPDGSLKLPSLQGLTMRDALVALQGAGLQVRARGSGRVFGQSPTAGSPLLPGQVVELVLQ